MVWGLPCWLESARHLTFYLANNLLQLRLKGDSRWHKVPFPKIETSKACRHVFCLLPMLKPQEHVGMFWGREVWREALHSAGLWCIKFFSQELRKHLTPTPPGFTHLPSKVLMLFVTLLNESLRFWRGYTFCLQVLWDHRGRWLWTTHIRIIA